MRANIAASILLVTALGGSWLVQAQKQAPASTTVVARVLEPDGVRPAVGLRVLLEPSLDPEKKALRKLSLAPVKGLRTLDSGADGSARFEALAPGRYALRAELSPILFAEIDPLTVAAGESAREVRIVLPPYGRVAGRLLGCESVSLEGFSIVVFPADSSLETRLGARGRPDLKGTWRLPPIAADGSFRSEPLRAGRSSVSLGYPAIRYQFGSGGDSTDWGPLVELGNVEVPSSGELRVEFDLAGRLPGRIELELKVHGKPGANTNVSVMSADEQPRKASIALDGRGIGLSGPIPPGELRLVVFGPREEWTWYPKQTWNVASGETLKLSLDAPIVEGEVQLVDAAGGAPLAREEVLVVPDDDIAAQRVLRTDKEGRLTLHLEPGRYRIEFGLQKGKDAPSPFVDVVLDWSEASAASQKIAVARKR